MHINNAGKNSDTCPNCRRPILFKALNAGTGQIIPAFSGTGHVTLKCPKCRHIVMMLLEEEPKVSPICEEIEPIVENIEASKRGRPRKVSNE